ncbi:Protocadherin Fat 2 [Eumeta japonica]|uniref:Protocadherin Fat 2 n=1 Tax=Eumeta variegata TaxID=151549 RepID=A0A4C1YX09_EUMVA|nr:Protocadherin Fat 2 [Eumeta japonica]
MTRLNTVAIVQVQIRATDGGTEPGPLATDVTLTVIFVPTIADPVFRQSSASVAIFEYENGLEERHQLPLADDPKNYRCSDDCVDIYYHILDGNEDGHFVLDARTNVLSLASALNRSEAAAHALTVGATNAAQPPTAAAVPAAARLALAVNLAAPRGAHVRVQVREAEPRPRFVRGVYHAGISATDSIGRELLTLQVSAPAPTPRNVADLYAKRFTKPINSHT